MAASVRSNVSSARTAGPTRSAGGDGCDCDDDAGRSVLL